MVHVPVHVHVRTTPDIGSDSRMTDSRGQFVAKEFEEIMLKNGIKHIRSARAMEVEKNTAWVNVATQIVRNFVIIS